MRNEGQAVLVASGWGAALHTYSTGLDYHCAVYFQTVIKHDWAGNFPSHSKFQLFEYNMHMHLLHYARRWVNGGEYSVCTRIL